ncbi:hypothetical protein A5700_24085 [Mycobacterium sp. E1214]|uniref:hypothetical protein n=1 Tax=Mycobacterium sp. E1214 TaxID=1834123 RepID=UPI0007FC0A2B|nr:hypothetical protein [Mycobacterium sp. E1214]OBG75590.1 hypothetical protein A5700_24085 [Mycobacterium sp. E1214]
MSRRARIGAVALAAALAGCLPLAPARAEPGAMFGDPAKAAQYWARQSYDNNCVLMSVAGVVGQITGRMPGEQEVIDVAQHLPSVAHQGKTVFTDVNNGELVNSLDIVALLGHYGVGATTSEQSNAGAALDALKSALGSGHAALVPVSSRVIWHVDEADRGPSDHEVVVTGVDADVGVVHLNDSGTDDGRDAQLPVANFTSAWAAGDYELTVTQQTVQ